MRVADQRRAIFGGALCERHPDGYKGSREQGAHRCGSERRMSHLADAAGCRGFRIGVDVRNAAGRRDAQQSRQQAHHNEEPAESYP